MGNKVVGDEDGPAVVGAELVGLELGLVVGRSIGAGVGMADGADVGQPPKPQLSGHSAAM